MIRLQQWPLRVLTALCIGHGLLEADAAGGRAHRRRRTVPSFTFRIGGTLGLTGKYRVTSMHAFQGLTLFKEIANNNSIFRTSSNNPIEVELDIRNDNSNKDDVRNLYQEMINENRSDAFVGPYSSGLSTVASRVTSDNGMLMMLHQASTPAVYQQGFQNLFSVNVMATDYFAGGLRMLWEAGAKTVVLAEGSASFHKALCEGAALHARNLGYEILNRISITGSEITQAIHVTAKQQPDVVVGCGHLHNAIQLTVIASALMLNPKAMLMAQATSDNYVEAVLAANANYILGPVTWDKSLQGQCRVFGSPMNFFKLYSERWHMEPTYHSVQAAAAGIALLSAAERADQAGPPSRIRKELLNLNIETVFGILNFSSNGTRNDVTSLTQQLWPFPAHNISAAERYRKLQVVLLSEENPPRYPMPTWEQRELEIYPCNVGYALNRSQPLSTQCEACLKGTYRNAVSSRCRRCPGGKYGLEAGLKECHTCERGMHCGLIRSEGRLLAADGWFLVEGGSAPVFVQCDPPGVCLQANRCKDHYIGVLCSKCAKGYTDYGIKSTQKRVCTQCPSWLWELAGILLLFVVYQGAYHLIMYSHYYSSASLMAMHTIILRVIFNYLQFASTLLEATGVANDLPQGYRLVVATFLDPFEHFINLDCILQDLGLKPYEVLVLLGIFLLPIVLLCCVAVILLRDLLLPFLLLRIRVALGMQLAAEATGEPEGIQRLSREQLPVDPRVSNEDSERYSRTESSLGAGHSEENAISRQASSNLLDQDKDLLAEKVQIDGAEVFPEAACWNFSWEMILSMLRDKFTRSAVAWVFLLYPAVLDMLFVGSTCVEKDRLRLAADLDVVCHSSEHIRWFRISVFGLMMYGVGLPSLLFFQLYRVRHKLYDVRVRREFGILYNGFERSFYYFEIVFMIRKLLILLAASIPDKFVRMLGMLGVGFVFMGIHIRFNLYDNRDFFLVYRLESLNLFALMIPCLARLFIDMRNTLPPSDFSRILHHFFLDWLIWLVCGSVHAAFLGIAIWGLLRNTTLKHLRFMEECFPECLTPMQRCLLKLAEKRWHYVKMDPDTHELDISSLSAEEKYFLHQALIDTVRCYLVYYQRSTPNSESEAYRFYVGFMIAALRRAYKRVERSRLRRAQHCLRAMQHAEAKASASKRCFVCWVLAQTGADYLPARGDTMAGMATLSATLSDESHLSKTVLACGATVEDLHLALMLCWPEIQEGRGEYFVLETPEDRKRAFWKEVKNAAGTTWRADESVQRLFSVIAVRRNLQPCHNGDDLDVDWRNMDSVELVSEDSADPDMKDLLGFQPAGEEQANRRAMRQEHNQLLEEVLELRTKVEKLQHQVWNNKSTTVLDPPVSVEPEAAVGHMTAVLEDPPPDEDRAGLTGSDAGADAAAASSAPDQMDTEDGPAAATASSTQQGSTAPTQAHDSPAEPIQPVTPAAAAGADEMPAAYEEKDPLSSNIHASGVEREVAGYTSL